MPDRKVYSPSAQLVLVGGILGLIVVKEIGGETVTILRRQV